VKNRIYSYLFLGISLTFPVTGHTQKKQATKPSTHSTSTPPLHSKAIKPTIKTLPESATKPKTSDTKTALTPKSADKKANSIPSKLQVTKPYTAKPLPITASKTATKKQPIISTLKNTKQLSAKSKHQTHIIATESDSRKHTVISSKSIENTKPFNKKKQKNFPTTLVLDTAKSNETIHANTEKQRRPYLIEHTQSTKINTAHVSIETSLFLDGLEAGLSKELILQLTDVFAWDIDFATNLRPGDQFTIVYEKKIIDGKETDSDQIIAAEFINQGSSHTAVRYINESGAASYYTPDGQSMQRAFLTTPVDFAKISSPFDMHRMHPILNRIRAHKGIDYAARIGTPVKTTGDGIISFNGNKGAYGQVVIIQHNDHYETLYAHMSEFRKGLGVGDHVKQGDVIGYVGQSGLATGPHLHYEFHVDGLYRDPESVKIPHSMPISDALLDDFNAQTQPFFAQLNQVKAKSLYAKNHSAITPSIIPPATLQQLHFD
jgi:murein DD-endopeptidase MepM/ murein hydrolase activator NlpD